MKRVSVIGLVAIALIASSTTAHAEGRREHRDQISTWKSENDAKRDAYKQALVDHFQAKKNRVESMKEIATDFKSEADALRTKIRAAVDAATTVEAKKAAAAAGKAEMESLIAKRKASIDALPPVGKRPAKPTMAPRPAKPAKTPQG